MMGREENGEQQEEGTERVLNGYARITCIVQSQSLDPPCHAMLCYEMKDPG